MEIIEVLVVIPLILILFVMLISYCFLNCEYLGEIERCSKRASFSIRRICCLPCGLLYFITKARDSLTSEMYSLADFPEVRYETAKIYEFYMKGILGGTAFE